MPAENGSIHYRKWLIWSLMAVAFLVVFIHRYSIAAVADDLARELGLTGAALSNLASMYFYAYAVMQIPSGILADYVGPRLTAALGMLVAAAGSLLFAIAAVPAPALVGRLLVGLGVSVIFVSTLKIQAEWFRPREFATISGLTSVVGNIGGILATTPLALLVTFVGWRPTFLAIAAVSVAVAVAIYLVVRNRPEAAGYPAQGPRADREGISLGTSLKMIVTNPATWPNFIILFSAMSIINAFSGLWGVPFLMHTYRMAKAEAAQYILYLTAGVLVGSPLVGWLSDRLGRKKPVMMAGTGMVALLWFYLLVVAGGKPPVAALSPIFFMMGLGGISFILTFANVKEVNHPAFSGMATSFVNSAGFIGTALLNLAVGTWLDQGWTGQIADGMRFYTLESYRSTFLAFLALSVVAFAATWLVREKAAAPKGEFAGGQE
ncbi:MAG: MFS transporter [Bacillota bacterium]